MKRTLMTLAVAGAVIALVEWRTTASPAHAVHPPLQSQIARGEYLVTIAACDDCHTPMKMGPHGPEPDFSLRLSGHPQSLVMPPAPKLANGPWMWAGAATNTAFAGPWGISYARNLTPDKLTGIGIWNEQTFMKTLRTGRHWGVARPILPPMPWQSFSHMTDDDLRAIFVYLRSIKPIHNEVPDAVVAPPPSKG